MKRRVVNIAIDRTKCIGSGNCVFNAKATFEQDDEGFPKVIALSAQPVEVVEAAAASCPVGAIRVEVSE